MCRLPPPARKHGLRLHGAYRSSTMSRRRTLALLSSAAFALAGCAQPQPKVRAELNREAWLVGNLPANPLHWKVISASMDTDRATMSTLYGNDVAVAYARSHADHDYPAGAIISL